MSYFKNLSPQFCESILANIISNTLIIIVFSFIVDSIIKNYKKPKLTIFLSISHNVNGAYLNFYCINSGMRALQKDKLKW
jgi:membrane-bound acyltransferase YfiQ involved in biofilm formation